MFLDLGTLRHVFFIFGTCYFTSVSSSKLTLRQLNLTGILNFGYFLNKPSNTSFCLNRVFKEIGFPMSIFMIQFVCLRYA